MNSSKLKPLAYAATMWIGFALAHVVGGYLKAGARGVNEELLDFLFLSLVLAPVVPALLSAQRLEQRLKSRFPLGASFMAIATALVISAPVGFWLAARVLRYIEG